MRLRWACRLPSRNPKTSTGGCLLGPPMPRLRCGTFHGRRSVASQSGLLGARPTRSLRERFSRASTSRSTLGPAVPPSKWEGWSRPVCSLARRTDDLCTLFMLGNMVAQRAPINDRPYSSIDRRAMRRQRANAKSVDTTMQYRSAATASAPLCHAPHSLGDGDLGTDLPLCCLAC